HIAADAPRAGASGVDGEDHRVAGTAAAGAEGDRFVGDEGDRRGRCGEVDRLIGTLDHHRVTEAARVGIAIRRRDREAVSTAGGPAGGRSPSRGWYSGAGGGGAPLCGRRGETPPPPRRSPSP